MQKYQVAVIGGGPGGYVAALRCAQLGFKTACIDKRKHLGGTCLNVGCIPSKSLLHASEIYSLQKKAAEYGLGECNAAYNFPALMEQKDQVVEGLVKSVDALVQKRQIDRFEGSASLKSPRQIAVKTAEGGLSELEADFIILATGSEPIPLPFAPFDEKNIVSSTGALALPQVPAKLIVVGGGVIGVEIASIYQRLGSEVTVLEMLNQICPGVDLQASKLLQQLLTKQGIAFHLQAKVTELISQPQGTAVKFEKESSSSSLEAPVTLVCVGRRPYTEGLNLEAAGVKLDSKGRVEVDGSFRTSRANIFAIGDLIAGPGLAHRASQEGIAVANFLAGRPAYVNYLAIPNVIYTFPEVASVGFTEEEAQAKKLELLKGVSFFRGNPRARCNHTMEGYVKILGDKQTGKLLGMHIIGPQASELIAVGAVALEGRMTLSQLAELPFAHPTLSEGIKEAAQLALGQAIHVKM